MELTTNILLIIIIIVILVILVNYFKSDKIKLSNLKAGTEEEIIRASTLSSNSASNNYAYSLWFYVDNWQYKLTDQKILLSRSSKNLSNVNNPLITLAPYENNINISITTYSNPDKNKNDITISDIPTMSPSCMVSNFPLQKWVNLILSLNGRTADIYLDGKLVRTCVLPGVPKIDSGADIHITPDGGFSGWTANFHYWDKPLNPQEAYNIYKKGYGGGGLFGGLSGMVNKYKLKVAYLVNDKEEGSFEI